MGCGCSGLHTHPPCCCLSSPAGSRQGPKPRQEAGRRLRLKSPCSGSRGGTKSAQPHTRSITRSSGSVVPQHILLPQAPPSSVRVLALYAASHLHLGDCSKTHLLLKTKREKGKAAATPASLALPASPSHTSSSCCSAKCTLRTPGLLFGHLALTPPCPLKAFLAGRVLNQPLLSSLNHIQASLSRCDRGDSDFPCLD